MNFSKEKEKNGGKGSDGGGIRQEWKTDVAESSRYNYIRNVVASIIVIASFCCMQRWATLRTYAKKGIGFPSEEELDLVSGCARGMGEDTGFTRIEWEEYWILSCFGSRV